MSTHSSPREFLVISRGQWDESATREQIESVIDRFYVWLQQKVDEGTMKRGQRLTYEGKSVRRKGLIVDGPFGETKEVIGGYWFLLAPSLEEAARIAEENPCLEYGLFLEIRPTNPDRATPENTR